MKEFLKKYKRISELLVIVWVFIVPYQIYFNSGISVSVSIILLCFLGVIVCLYTYCSGFSGILELFKRYIVVVLLALSFTISSLLNLSTFESKELLRWLLFLLELVILLELLRLKITTIKLVSKTVLLSTVSMILITFYQLFIPQEVELNLFKGIWGQIFNDPDFIKERFSGLGKFNWLYGDSIRAHGIFTNVSHFAFLLGASLLIYINQYIRSWSWKHSFVAGTLFAFITLSLVRSVSLSLIFIFIIYSIIIYREKKYQYLKGLLSIIVVSTVITLFLGFFSYERVILYSFIVRFFETISFDGALFSNQVEYIKSYFSRVNISSGEFNEYGGIGGRLGLLKITLTEIVLPRIGELFFLLFGLGPSSLGVYLKDTANEYFSRFNTIDNSYMQWFVELGTAPFIILLIFLKKSYMNLVEIFKFNWTVILFILINCFFFNLLPDIRMGMITAILISYIIFNRGK